MRKKILIALILVLFINIFVAEASSIDVERDDYDYNKILVVTSLGLMDENEDTAFSPDDILTRSELAKIAVVLSGVGISSMAANELYSDIDQGNKYSKYISTCKEHGFMVGAEEGIFNPDGNVTKDQLNAVIVRVLGLNEYAKQAGGFPQGYVDLANYIGINRFLYSGGEYVTRRNCAEYLYNLFDLAVPEIRFDGGKLGVFKDETKTIIEQFMRIKKVKGVVTGNEISSLPEGKTTASGKVQILGKTVGVGDTDIMECLGRNVEAYIALNNNDDYDYVLSYILTSGLDNDITVKAKDIYKKDSNSTQISVMYESSRKIYRFDSSIIVILNGEVLKSYSDATFKKDNGEMTLVDTDKSGKYDLIIIMEPISAIFSRYSPDAGVLSFKYGSTSIELDNSSKVDVYIDGQKSKLESLQEWMSLFIYKPLSSDYYIIKASSDSVTGKLTYIDGSEGIYRIDDVEYYLAYDYSVLSKQFENVRIGEIYTFILNPDDEILAIAQSKSGDFKYAYLIGRRIKNGGEDIYLKLFTENGEEITRKVRGKFKYNAGNGFSTYKSEKIKDTSLRIFDSSGEIIKQLIRYKEDENGDLSEILVAKDMRSDWKSKRDGFSLNYSATGTTSMSLNNNMLAGRFRMVDSKTIIFNVPGQTIGGVVYPADDMSDIRIAEAATYGGKTLRNFDLYDIDSFYRVGVVVIYNDKSSDLSVQMLTNSEIALVYKVVRSVLSDGEIGYIIKCYRDGKVIEAEVEPDLVSAVYSGGQWRDFDKTPISEIKSGDIIQISLQDGKKIDSFLVLGRLELIDYDRERVASSTITTPLGNQPSNRLSTIPGTVKDIDGSYLVVTSRAGNGDVCERSFNILSSTEVYVYNTNTKEVVLAGYGDIMPNDKIYVRTYDWAVRTAIVVR